MQLASYAKLAASKKLTHIGLTHIRFSMHHKNFQTHWQVATMIFI